MPRPPTVSAPDTRLLNRSTISAAALALLVFAIDAITPQGSGVGLLYVLPLLLGTLDGPPRFQYIAALVVSLLAVIGVGCVIPISLTPRARTRAAARQAGHAVAH